MPTERRCELGDGLDNVSGFFQDRAKAVGRRLDVVGDDEPNLQRASHLGDGDRRGANPETVVETASLAGDLSGGSLVFY